MVALTVIACVAVTRSVWDITQGRKGSSMHKSKHPDWYGTVFPESSFSPVNDKREDYRRRVQKGYSEMKKRSAVFVGLARDIGPNAQNTVALRREELPTS